MKNEKNLENKAFLMPISDVFIVTGRGTVVTGCVKSGIIRKGDELEIVGYNETKKVVAVQVAKFRQFLDEAKAGENIGIQLRGVKKEDITPGEVLATPGTAIAHSKFEAKCLILGEKEGGIPFCHRERMFFGLNTVQILGQMDLSGGADKAIPGDSVDVTIELLCPMVVEEGISFPIFKEGEKVATGVISKILK